MAMSAKELSELLARQCEDVCAMLLPGGKRDGKHWVAGSVDGESGRSLKVNLTGEKIGRFCDYASSDDFGDLLDLWQMARRVDFVTACKQAKEYLGIQEERQFSEKRYSKPQNFKSSKAAAEIDWLKGRMLTDETIKAFRVTGGAGKVYFPFFKGNELVACKWRSITEKETRATSEGQKPILFGWQAVGSVREITICEGEIDAMSLHQMGFSALSVPFGAMNLEWIENEWDDLALFDEIYICMDADKVGSDAAKKIINRLGAHRCLFVTLPAKDANECLQLGLIPQLKLAFKRAVTLDPSELKRPPEYLTEVLYEIYPDSKPGGRNSFPLPCKKHQDEIELREGELIIANGVNGHGKSQFVNQICIEAMRHGRKCVIASMEMKPARTLGRMVRQLTGTERPTHEYAQTALEWLEEKCWLFDCLGMAKFEQMMAVFEYAAMRYGVKIFVIDSLMKCGVAEDDYKGQTAVINRLCDFKNTFDVTVILVTHSRKGESEMHPTGKFDVKGSGGITDLADTVLTVWRNKPKEQAIENGQEDFGPDCLVVCSKQRNGTGWEGKIAYWFDRASLQYVSGPDSRVFPYLEKSLRVIRNDQ